MALIYERALFFAELSVYDYELILEERYLIAAACLLNGIQSMDDEDIHQKLPTRFLANLRMSLCVYLETEAVEHVQGRLWLLYSCSAQLQHEDITPLHIQSDRVEQKPFDIITFQTHSPVSVDDTY